MYSCHVFECPGAVERHEEPLKEFHSTESLRVVVPKIDLKSNDDKLAMKTLQRTLNFHDGCSDG